LRRDTDIDIKPFKLSEIFLDSYKNIRPNFGFDGLGEFVFYRTYSRIKEDETKEEWWEVCKRVIEWVFTKQKEWINHYNLGWNNTKAQKTAKSMYDRMFNFKWLPPGRGLWAAGTAITEERKLYSALNNCSFVSTVNLKEDLSKPFEFLMDMSMLGVGVGFDVKGAGQIEIKNPSQENIITYTIPDDREGWVESLKLLLETYFVGTTTVNFDYSAIRQSGTRIKGFGGVSSGYVPLKKMHDSIRNILNDHIGKLISETDIVDIMNLIGVAVVAGNVRRSASIVFGTSDEFINLKNYELNPQREEWGWASNNSILGEIGQSYEDISKRIADNAEPGVYWLSNAQKYSRMGDETWKDHKATGGNPCFSYDTQILTVDGYKPIGSLDGKIITTYNSDGAIKQAKVFYSGEKETLKISFENRKNEIVCTPDHRFLMNNGEEKMAKDFKRRDRLMPFLKYPELDNYYVLLGYMQGDASLGRLKSEKHHGVEIHIGKKDQSIYELLEGRKYTKDKSCKRAYLQDIKDDLIELGFSDESLPLREFPTSYNEWNKRQKSSFLRGCFSANGAVLKNYGRITYKATCKNFLEKLKDTLNIDFEISSFITTNKSKNVEFNNGIYKVKESYDLNISQFESRQKFFNEINFYHPYKTETLKWQLLKTSPSISAINKHNVLPVYDFTLGGDNHWGVINGMIASNCLEQTLESYELCCLVSTFLPKHDNLEDFKRTLKYAYMYAKTVTLCETHWSETNRVMLRNRRIGTSVGGVAEFIDDKGIDELKNWLEEGYNTVQYYDEVYSDWLAVPKSIKTTSVKPDGTVSLLAGTSPGIHFPEAQFYIRRVRLDKKSVYVELLKKAGYKVEQAEHQEDTVVVEFPVKFKNKVRSVRDVSMWEQLEIAAFAQKYWADNQVSCTITFNENESDQIEQALNLYQYRLKGISMLPLLDDGAYAQMPYEKISEQEYDKKMKKIKVIDWHNGLVLDDAQPEKYCDNEVCII